MDEVHIVRDSWADELFPQMGDDPHVKTVTKGIDRLASSLMDSVRCQFLDQGKGLPVPVVVLRGGLLMLDACRRATGVGPWGFLLPATRNLGEPVTFQRADIPVIARDRTYLIVDTIINSAQTVLAAISMLESIGAVSAPVESVSLACIFLTEPGEHRIRSQYPTLEVFTVWNRLAVGRNGWVTGVGFDAGDYAVGGGDGRRLQWAAG